MYIHLKHQQLKNVIHLEFRSVLILMIFFSEAVAIEKSIFYDKVVSLAIS